MTDITPLPTIKASPFDQIRRERTDGTEYWSARDLMPLMGYARWENFLTPVERAMKTAKNQHMEVNALFLRSQEKTGGRPREDFDLTRYAAYLVAMNGDPNIQNVADAQHYFAYRTREAETAPAAQALTEDEIVAQALFITTRKVEALEQRNAELSPRAEAFDSFIDATGHYSIGSVAKMLGTSQNRLFRDLRNHGVLIAKGSMRNTPYQRYMHHFAVKAHEYERSNGEPGTSYTTYVQASGIDFIRRKLGQLALVPTGGEVS